MTGKTGGAMIKPKRDISGQERNKLIYQLLRSKRRLKVAELQELLGVSDMTVRRCLNEMADDGLLRRVHGGAVALDLADISVPFQTKLMANQEKKIAIAKIAVDFIPAGGSVFLDGGTSSYEVARNLAASSRGCLVITDNLAILLELSRKPNIETILLAGRLSGDNNTIDGPLTAETAGKFSVDLAVVGAGGFNDDQLENRGFIGATTKRIMIQKAARSMCVADSSKYKNTKCFRFCGWDEIDVFVTDSALPPEALGNISAKGVTVHIAELPGE